MEDLLPLRPLLDKLTTFSVLFQTLLSCGAEISAGWQCCAHRNWCRMNYIGGDIEPGARIHACFPAHPLHRRALRSNEDTEACFSTRPLHHRRTVHNDDPEACFSAYPSHYSMIRMNIRTQLKYSKAYIFPADFRPVRHLSGHSKKSLDY